MMRQPVSSGARGRELSAEAHRLLGSGRGGDRQKVRWAAGAEGLLSGIFIRWPYLWNFVEVESYKYTHVQIQVSVSE